MRLSYRVCNMQEKPDAEETKKGIKRVNVMILGVGTDLVEIDRMRKACEKEYFVSRTFTEAESRQAGGSASKLAGSFAVKEAVAKVFGTGFRTFYAGRY